MRARAVLFAGVLAICGALGAATSTAQTTAPPPGAVFVADDAGRVFYKPGNLLIEAGVLVKGIKWKPWGSTEARGQGRFRVPKGAVVGLKAKHIRVKLRLTKPKECEVFDSAGNPIGTVMVFEETSARSLGKPGKCAIICATYNTFC